MRLKSSSSSSTSHRSPRVQMKGSNSATRSKKTAKRRSALSELADAMLTCFSYEDVEDVKREMCACCDTFLEDEEFLDLITPKTIEKIKKTKLVIEQIECKQRLEAYAFNFKLGCEGLRVHRVVR